MKVNDGFIYLPSFVLPLTKTNICIINSSTISPPFTAGGLFGDVDGC